MNIIICIKSVITRAPEGEIARTALSSELNPFDRPALTVARKLRDEQGGNLTALSMGPDFAADALYEALALGADRAVLLSDPALAGSDTLATSTALAAALKKLQPFDLVLFGARTSDSDTGQVGPQTAVQLGLPLVTGAMSLAVGAGGLRVERRADGFRETFEVDLPAVLTVHPGAAPAGDPPLPDLERAYATGKIETWSLAEVGLAAAQVGEQGSGTRVISLTRVSRERKCEFIEGEGEEQAEALVRRLSEKGLIE